METQVIHIEKHTSITGGLNRHITRAQWEENEQGEMVLATWVPSNADSSKTTENVDLIERGDKNNLPLQTAVNKRIKEAKVKLRKGQITSLEIIISGSHEVMKKMSRDKLLLWAEDSVDWAQETFRKENVVSACLHVDERTPHIHLIVVPIVTGQSRSTKKKAEKKKASKKYKIDNTKLRLCANEVFTRSNLYKFHDSYYTKVGAKYGLSRGVRAEPGSQKSHTSSIEYNRKLAKEAQQLEQKVDEEKERFVAAKEKADKAEKAASKAQLKENLADIGAKVAGVFGGGAIKEANKERDEANERAAVAEKQAAADREEADREKRAREAADTARYAAERYARRVEEKIDVYGRQKFEEGKKAGFTEGQMSKDEMIGQLKQRIDNQEVTINNIKVRAEKAEQELSILKVLNPYLADWKTHFKEMRGLGMKDADIQTVFFAGKKENVKIRGFEDTVMVQLSRNSEGKMRVWVNGQRPSVFIEKNRKNGLVMKM